ncbi:MAG TPA: hypothetical protein VN893_11520 [Bryobacteraceae bacterium]|nr:hypothetical protein [Bryobacteraceae bacterium]
MIRIALLVAAGLALTGCSKPQLNQETAARVIRESAHFREPGFVGVDHQDAPSDCKAKIAEDADWRTLARIGWLQVHDEEDFERASEGQAAVKCVGTLSGDGLRAGAALNTSIYEQWRIPAAARELVAIQSITYVGDGLATVRFTTRWRLNAFGGQILQVGHESAGAAVVRHLDGSWQLADFTSLPDLSPVRLP